MNAPLPDVDTLPLDAIDVSEATLYQQDIWRPHFARLRADEFVIDRKNPRYHLSFGFGIHRCMGNRLGEMQLRILWEEILQRFSHVEVVSQPERVLSNFVRGYSSLPVVLHG